MPDTPLPQAYAWCQDLARRHYENFPVASRLLPARLRRPVAAIYAFARTADDLADEGDAEPAKRLAALDAMDRQVQAIAAGAPPEGHLFTALADTVRRHALPIEPLRDLLTAFRMDVTTQRYADFGALMAYCRCSANPVGRLLLHLYGAATPRNLGCSDAVCTALQLINFLQDLEQDYVERGRIYIPQDECAQYGVTEAHFRDRLSDPAMTRLLVTQTQRAARLLRAGAPLGKELRGRIGLELRMIILGGRRVLDHLQARRDDLFSRPQLGLRDWGWIAWHALRRK